MKFVDVLEMVICIDLGRICLYNEDVVFVDVGLGVVILVDGMGGYKVGEVVSGMVIIVFLINFFSFILV